MKETCIPFQKSELRMIDVNTVVVGSGAAGLNAACRLHALGQTDVAIITENMNAGTSRNTGSDKQTYYKLSLSGGDGDSVREMAANLFSGHGVDGDLALCEAALSAESFLRLADLGVPFPRNRYGEFVGYKTDHDPRRRASSVGPYTSRMMTEALERDFRAKNIALYDMHLVIRILTKDGNLTGLLCLVLNGAEHPEFVAFHCKNVVYATGGPAGIYADSVYPHGHYGATGVALAAGAKGRNLTEWQYGLASVKPRWNVSGTYMQVLPRFVSTNQDGGDEQEFLCDFSGDNASEMLSKVFLKGYQWPFDVRKLNGGSSLIDLLVYVETLKGRKVFLDFRSNPRSGIDFLALPAEARDYLKQAGADFGSPLERLKHMNLPAYEFYKDKGVDLEKEMLQIALCAQHNNGGLAVDCWWQTNIDGLFAVGEASASHGVYRPGGSALNAGQVGSTRAAQYISVKRCGEPENSDAFAEQALAEAKREADFALAALSDEAKENVQSLWEDRTIAMSRIGAAIRDSAAIIDTAEQVKQMLESLSKTVKARPCNIHTIYRLRDMLQSQFVILNSISDYIKAGGHSRGSALYSDASGEKPHEKFPDLFRFVLDDGSRHDIVQEVCCNEENVCNFTWRKVRPIPGDDDFFENVWRTFRENGNIY